RFSRDWSSDVCSSDLDTADHLKKHSGFIPGYRPGERTAEYIDYVLTRVTAIGAVYLVLVCLLPEFLIASTGIPFYLGGTSLLIRSEERRVGKESRCTR